MRPSWATATVYVRSNAKSLQLCIEGWVGRALICGIHGQPGVQKTYLVDSVGYMTRVLKITYTCKA